MVQIADDVERSGVIYKTDGAPEIVIFVDEIIPAVSFNMHTTMDMFGKGAHVLHDEFRLLEHMRVDALQNEFIFRLGIQCDNVRVVDVAIAGLFDLGDVPAGFELFRDIVEIFQRSASYFVMRVRKRMR